MEELIFQLGEGKTPYSVVLHTLASKTRSCIDQNYDATEVVCRGGGGKGGTKLEDVFQIGYESSATKYTDFLDLWLKNFTMQGRICFW